jgi:hypothetical protein
MAEQLALLVAAGFPLLLLIPFAIFRWRYLRVIERTIYQGPQADHTLPSARSVAGASVVFDEGEAAPQLSAPAQAALAGAGAAHRRRRRAFLAASILFAIVSAVIVWRGQVAAGVGYRAAFALAYFSTLPSFYIATLFSRSRRHRWWAPTLTCFAAAYPMLVGPLRVPARAATDVMMSGATFVGPALVCIALMSLRSIRTLLAGYVSVVTTLIMLAWAAQIRLGALNLEGSGGVNPRSIAAGMFAACLGVAIAIAAIRRSAVARAAGLLAGVFALGTVGAFWTPGVATAMVAGVGFNGLLTLIMWSTFGVLLRLKSRGYLPDEVLHVVLCWVVLTVFVATFAGTELNDAALLLVPVTLSSVVLGLALLHARRGVTLDAPKRMILLRVFGERRTRHRLLDTLDDTWRYVGSVEVVVGTDVAIRTLDAAALQDFVVGRIDRQIITSETTIARRIAPSAPSRALDGRYAVREYLCLGTAWQQAVSALVSVGDVVLMDLRGFQRVNVGAAFELALVAQRVSPDRIVLLIDDATDMALAGTIVEDAWLKSSFDSTSGGTVQRRLSVVRCASSGDISPAIRRIFGAAFGSRGVGLPSSAPTRQV